MSQEQELCPICQKHGLKEILLLIPEREGRKQHLYCSQCEGEFPCNDEGKRTIPKRMIPC